MLYYWSRQIRQWNRTDPKVRKEFEPYMEATLGSFREAFGRDPFWGGFKFSNDNLRTMYDRFHPKRPFDEHDSKFWGS